MIEESKNEYIYPAFKNKYLNKVRKQQKYITYLQTLVDAQKSALKKLTTCLREAECQKTELMKDLDDQRKKLEKEVSKNNIVQSGSKSDQQSSPSQSVRI